jgi:putative intracellular protease/amidase
MWDFPDDAGLQAITASVYDRGGVVGAVCHGPAALANVRLADGSSLVAGKPVACFTNEEETAAGLTNTVPFLLESRLAQPGATVEKAGADQPKVVRAGRLVTGQNPASASDTAEAVVAAIRGK